MPNEPKKYLSAVPWFPGFYESTLDSFIDREVECEMEGNGEDRPAKTWEEVNEYANYQAARLAITEAWIAEFAKEVGLEMEMESLQSPREYNFTTDRPFVHISAETLKKLKPMRRTKAFREVLKEWFTERPGFMPFYSNEPEAESWRKPVEEFDHNEISALIAAYAIHKGHDPRKLREDIEERSNVYEAAQHVWDALPEPQAEAA